MHPETDFLGRITPAYAGKSRPKINPFGQKRDHPRVCGEKKASPAMTGNPQGSPPRMRGKVGAKNPEEGEYRITPAYAGKRDQLLLPKAAWGDHPRVCGEKLPRLLSLALASGSPPRVRGKVFAKVFDIVVQGITPACAGKRPAGK